MRAEGSLNIINSKRRFDLAAFSASRIAFKMVGRAGDSNPLHLLLSEKLE